MKKLAIAVLITIGSLVGQPPPSNQVNLVSTVPTPPQVGASSVTGTSGNNTYYYWVVANYPGGSINSNPAQVSNIANVDSTNKINVSWSNNQSGATSYDVLRTTTNVFPGSSCTCGVALAQTPSTTSVFDTGAALVAYTKTAGLTPVTGTIGINSLLFNPALFTSSLGWLVNGNIYASNFCINPITCLSGGGGGFLPYTYVIGPGFYASIRDAWNACIAANPPASYTCILYETNITETMNAPVWTADHSEHRNVALYIGSTILKTCDAGIGTDGLTCAAPFTLATGNGAKIVGTNSGGGTFLGDVGSTIRAGSLQDGSVPLITIGDTSTNQDAFSAAVTSLNIDCNNVPFMIGLKNQSAQENALAGRLKITNCPGIGMWYSGIRTSNSDIAEINITPGPQATAASIALFMENSATPRDMKAITINGLGNNVNSSMTTAIGTAATGVVTGLQAFNAANIAPGIGPNGSNAYVYVQNLAIGWNGVHEVTAVTPGGCTTACTGMTMVLVAGLASDFNCNTLTNCATPGSASLQLTPTYGAVACAGSSCSGYLTPGTTGQSISASTISVNQFNNLHMQHFGIGADVSGSTAISAVFSGPTCAGDVGTCVKFESGSQIRDGEVKDMYSGGAQFSVSDGISGRTVSDTFISEWYTGTAPPATGGPLFNIAVPMTFIYRAAPTTGTHCVAGIGTLYADSGTTRLKICDNGTTAVNLVKSGVDINANDQVSKISGTLSSYNNITKDANNNGIGFDVANFTSTGNAANVTTQTLIASATAGRYELVCYIAITQAATTSSTTPSCRLKCTDPFDSVAKNIVISGTSAANTTAVGIGGAGLCDAAAGTAVQMDTNSYASSGATPMLYKVYAILKQY